MKKFSTLLITCLLATCILMIGCVSPPPSPPPPPPVRVPSPPPLPVPETVKEWLEIRNFQFTIGGNGYIITANYIDHQGNSYNYKYDIPKTFQITVGGAKFEGNEKGYITITVPDLGTSVFTVGPGGLQFVK